VPDEQGHCVYARDQRCEKFEVENRYLKMLCFGCTPEIVVITLLDDGEHVESRDRFRGDPALLGEGTIIGSRNRNFWSSIVSVSVQKGSTYGTAEFSDSTRLARTA
jgi:hypothetical protein